MKLTPCLFALVASGLVSCTDECSSIVRGLYPRPLFSSSTGDCRATTNYCVANPGAIGSVPSQELANRLKASGPPEAQTQCSATIIFGPDPRLSSYAKAALKQAVVSSEHYSISIGRELAGRTIRIAADDDSGYLMAVRQLASLLGSSDRHVLSDAEIVDYPSIPIRGVVEGFYGPPYSIDERSTLMSLMADLRLNTYLYGPKDDDFAHANWAMPYSAELGAAITAAVETARSKGLRFIWAISPGLNAYGRTEPDASIKFSSDADFQTLIEKIESVRALGVSSFGLFVDDNSPDLYWQADITTFGSLASAHRNLANRLIQYLGTRDSRADLFFVGTKFSEHFADWENYNRTLADGLDGRIHVMWTGPETYSDTITVPDIARIASVINRDPIIWDNSPQTVGPLTGRAPNLNTCIQGMLSNPVLNEWRYHPVTDFWQVIGPIGAFLWRSETYNSDVAWKWWRAHQPAGLIPPPQ